MADSFWKTKAASLPRQVQWRYARLFEVAEELEALLELVVTTGGHARRALARACLGMADTLRRAAQKLDVAARRLMLTR